MTYLDTSAIIKRFVAEKGSVFIDSLVHQPESVATASIAYAEVYAGLTRRRREGRLSPTQYGVVCRQFETDWHAYTRVALADEILALAKHLIQRHPLRGFDAIHLASALRLKSSLTVGITFGAADAQLLLAARDYGLHTVDVESAQPR